MNYGLGVDQWIRLWPQPVQEYKLDALHLSVLMKSFGEAQLTRLAIY